MKNPWKIRLAERRDIGELLVIEEAQFPEPWTKRILLDEIENTETRRYTVAYEKKRIRGLFGGHVRPRRAPRQHDRHPARKKKVGVSRPHCSTTPGPTPANGASSAPPWRSRSPTRRAIDLYYRYGFRPVGVRKNYYEKSHEDALILWADLKTDALRAASYAGIMMGLVLGIETSCDETAASVVDEDFHVLSSVIESSIDQHRAFGGVVPELAGRAHVATIGPVVRQALHRRRARPPRSGDLGHRRHQRAGTDRLTAGRTLGRQGLRAGLGRALRRGQPPGRSPLRAAAGERPTWSGRS